MNRAPDRTGGGTGRFVSRTWKRLAVLLVAATIAALAAPAAPAAASYLDVRVTQSNVNMRACASTSCARIAQSNPSDQLTSWCYRSGQTVNGTPYWDVVVNRTTGTAGFISEALLTDNNQGSDCTFNPNGLVTGVTQNGVNIRACASTICNVAGQANAGQTLISFCFMGGQNINGNVWWDVVYNQATGTAGFVTEYYLTDKSQLTHCTES